MVGFGGEGAGDEAGAEAVASSSDASDAVSSSSPGVFAVLPCAGGEGDRGGAGLVLPPIAPRREILGLVVSGRRLRSDRTDGGLLSGIIDSSSPSVESPSFGGTLLVAALFFVERRRGGVD
jgi:hypothetical protein